MELKNFVRKPFPVKAIQVDFLNAYDVAEWCGGEVVLQATQLLGGAGKGKMDLPTVVFKGTGEHRDKELVAKLGDWVVELRGNFRVFKKAQFKATFDPAPEKKIEGVSIKAAVVDEIAENEFCIDHNCTFSECNQLHLDEQEEIARADQEREDAEHAAGQL